MVAGADPLGQRYGFPSTLVRHLVRCPVHGCANPGAPTVTVIVPFFETKESVLHNLLQALSNQDYPLQRTSVVLVDNNLVDARFRPRHASISVRIVHSPRPIGSFAARNAGLEISDSDIVLFTDSDCLPHRRWIAEMVRAISTSPCCVVGGGTVRVTVRRPCRPTLVEDFDRRMHLRQQDYLSRGFAATANLGTCTAVVRYVGPFSGSLLSGGDEEWCERVRAMGFEVISVPGSVVRHPARRDLTSILIKNRRGCGALFMRRQTRGGESAISSLVGEFGRMGQRWCRLWADGHSTPVLRRCGLISIFVLIEAVRLIEFVRLAAGSTPERR